MEEKAIQGVTATKPSSLSSPPTTPSPALAATSFSQSVPSTSGSLSASSPIAPASPETRARSRSRTRSTSRSKSSAPRSNSTHGSLRAASPPVVGHALRILHHQYSTTRSRKRRSTKSARKIQTNPLLGYTDSEEGYAGKDKATREPNITGAKVDDSDPLWLEIRLSGPEWGAFQSHVERLEQEDPDFRDYVDTKLRYDYFTSCDLLVLRFRGLRMPDRIHEWLIRRLDNYVAQQLRELSEHCRQQDPDSTAAQFADEVQPWGSLRMRFSRVPSSTPPVDPTPHGEQETVAHPAAHKEPPSDPRGQHEPDCSYSATSLDPAYPNLYPGTIIEVVTSKKRGRLQALADEYLLGADGPIVQVMLAVDIDIERLDSGLKPRGLAKVIEYRRQTTEAEDGITITVKATEHVFRDQDGKRKPGEVNLSLQDFAPYGFDTRLGDNVRQPSVCLTFDWLNDMLAKMEVQATIAATQTSQLGTKRKADDDIQSNSKRFAWPAGAKLRSQKAASEERLTAEDEQRVQREEEDAERKADRGDRAGARDYVPPPQRGRSVTVTSEARRSSRTHSRRVA